MSRFGSLKEFVEKRLSAAAEDILEAFKKVINEYEDQVVCQQRLLVNISKTQRTGEWRWSSVCFYSIHDGSKLIKYIKGKRRLVIQEPKSFQWPRDLYVEMSVAWNGFHKSDGRISVSANRD